MQPPYEFRALQTIDHSLIYSSWLTSFEPYRDQHIAREVYFQEHHNLIEKRLRISAATWAIACNPKDRDQIFGYLTGRQTRVGLTLDYVYVKPIYRRLGIAAALLKWYGNPVAHTHYTDEGERWLRKHSQVASVYDPYL